MGRARFLLCTLCIFRRVSLHTATAPAVRAGIKTQLSYRNDTIIAFSSQLAKIKTVGMLLWPLLVVNLRILGLIRRVTAYFVQNNTTIISYLATLDLQASCYAERRRPIFGAKLEVWRHKVFHIFHFLQSNIVLEIVKSLSVHT